MQIIFSLNESSRFSNPNLLFKILKNYSRYFKENIFFMLTYTGKKLYFSKYHSANPEIHEKRTRAVLELELN